MSHIFLGLPSWIIPMVIIFLSVISLTIILERFWILSNRISSLKPQEQSRLLDYLKTKKFDDAASFCRLKEHPAYKIILVMLDSKDKSKREAKYIIEQYTLQQIGYLERYISALGNISTVAPLLGLLGTVTGMIKAFKAFEMNIGNNTQLFTGIDEALITTALGLIVAVPSLTMYNYFTRKVGVYIKEINLSVNTAANLLKLND